MSVMTHPLSMVPTNFSQLYVAPAYPVSQFHYDADARCRFIWTLDYAVWSLISLDPELLGGSRGDSESTERSSQHTLSNGPQCSVIGAHITQPVSQPLCFSIRVDSGLPGLILSLCILRELLLNELFI